tara:strand:- start:4112 stop:4771 length:660 start_codon:yes stop_codon:yes gene_type:complete
MNTIPWPSIHKLDKIGADETNPVLVPLIEDYLFDDMWYLDTDPAKPIFEKQADIIIEKQSKGIVDVGCRHGPVVDILYSKGYTDFCYMGFDTSVEPIAIANKTWNKYNNIEFRNTSWDNIDNIKVNFNVDMVIWSGVLLYRPQDHFELFKNITIDLYNSKNAIIQEPHPAEKQKHWDRRLLLNTIVTDLDKYYENFKIKDYEISCEIFSGNRLVLDVCI